MHLPEVKHELVLAPKHALCEARQLNQWYLLPQLVFLDIVNILTRYHKRPLILEKVTHAKLLHYFCKNQLLSWLKLLIDLQI